LPHVARSPAVWREQFLCVQKIQRRGSLPGERGGGSIIQEAAFSSGKGTTIKKGSELLVSDPHWLNSDKISCSNV
jgi:hypothetical protein